MYKKVLAAVNEHVNSEVAARYALGLAREAGATLYLMHAAPRGESREVLDRAAESVRRVFERALEAGLKAEAVFETGDPATVIEKYTRREGMDLVFSATRHMSGKVLGKGLLRGCLSRRLLDRLPSAVAVVRVIHLGRSAPHEVLVPLKSRVGRISERAMFTAMVARSFGARIVLFHAAEPVERFFHGKVHITPAELESRLPADITEFSQELAKYEIRHDKRAIAGHAGKAITIEAARKRSDLIVMGASERGLLTGLIGESPVEHLLRESPCDLIIFRPRHGH